MKKASLLMLIVAGVLFVSASLFAFKSPSETASDTNTKGYEYMTVVALTTGSGKGLNLSIGGRDFKQIELPKDNKGWYDFNFFLTFIQEYEGYGWVLEPGSMSYSVSPNGNATAFAVMKKSK
ncbi:MAG: hypothetical protein ACK40G_13875 [Cytophagaceae bacterium]